jgi:hypothetical protein
MKNKNLPEFDVLPIGAFIILRIRGKDAFQKITSDGLCFGSIGEPNVDEKVYRCAMTKEGVAVKSLASSSLVQSLKDELAADRDRLANALNPSSWGASPWGPPTVIEIMR